MNIALSADHRGSASIRALSEKLAREGHTTTVLGDCSGQACDYPEPAYAVAKAVAEGRFEIGILICGTGIGMSIAANKIKGVRAAVVHDELTAQLSRSHNDANILALGARLTSDDTARELVTVFIETPYEGGRHQRRVDKIHAIEQDPT